MKHGIPEQNRGIVGAGSRATLRAVVGGVWPCRERLTASTVTPPTSPDPPSLSRSLSQCLCPKQSSFQRTHRAHGTYPTESHIGFAQGLCTTTKNKLLLFNPELHLIKRTHENIYGLKHPRYLTICPTEERRLPSLSAKKVFGHPRDGLCEGDIRADLSFALDLKTNTCGNIPRMWVPLYARDY